jgi:hypothetical protein
VNTARRSSPRVLTLAPGRPSTIVYRLRGRASIPLAIASTSLPLPVPSCSCVPASLQVQLMFQLCHLQEVLGGVAGQPKGTAGTPRTPHVAIAVGFSKDVWRHVSRSLCADPLMGAPTWQRHFRVSGAREAALAASMPCRFVLQWDIANSR